MDSIPAEGATLVVGGDGRYYSKEAINIIIKIAAGNKVNLVNVGFKADHWSKRYSFHSGCFQLD